MMNSVNSLRTSDRFELFWIMSTVWECGIKSARYFASLLRHAAVQERSRRELSKLDDRMLQDIGLEPFDVYYGWRGKRC